MTAPWLDALARETIDWTMIEATFPFVPAMRACVQDPIHHAEGDAWTHTRMVGEEIAREPAFAGDAIGRLTALYHDVHKPETRTVEMREGIERVSHPSHARRGAKTAWGDLWAAGVALDERLAVYGLCLWHQKVFHLWEQDRETMIRRAIEFALIGRWDRLIGFARCDTRGRIAPDNAGRVADLDLLEQWLDEEGLREGHAFTDSTSRLYYLEKVGRSHVYAAQSPAGSRVTLMSGLPGSGKDTWIGQNRPGVPVVSADDIREKLGVDPGDDQGRVVQAVRETMRVHLRAKTPFVLNATNVTHQMREGVIGLCRSYDAHVEIVALDRPLDVVLRQNRDRDRVVPEAAIRALIRKWEPPLPLEAHEVVWA